MDVTSNAISSDMVKDKTKRNRLAKNPKRLKPLRELRERSPEVKPKKIVKAPKTFAAPVDTKRARVLNMLRRKTGVTISEIALETGWQPHSVRGFLAGTVKKKLGFSLTSERMAGAVRHYRIENKRSR